MRIALLVLALAVLVAVGMFRSEHGIPGAEPVATPALPSAETPPSDVAAPREAPRRARAGTSSGEESPPSATARGVDATTGVVSGIVRRATDGKHVVGATVRWFLGPGAATYPTKVVVPADLQLPSAGTTTTDAEGGFAFDVADGVAWEVHVVADGYSVVAARGRGSSFADLELEEAAAAEFRVVTGDPRVPVAAAVVHAFADESADVPCATVVADESGRGSAPLGSEGWLLATAPGFSAGAGRGRAEGGIEIVLLPGAAIEGDVVDAAGLPVAGARVVCDALANARDLASATGADGQFAFVVPTGGIRNLWVAAEGFAAGRVRALPGDVSVRIQLDAAAWVEGTATDARGQVLEELRVRSGESLGGGRFRVGPLAPGLHDIEVGAARDGGWVTGFAVLAVRPGERRTGVEIVVPDMPDRSEVVVQVLDPQGRPTGDTQVWLTRGDDLQPIGFADVGPDPDRVTLPVPAGTAIRVHVTPDGRSEPWVAPAAVETRSARRGEAEPVVVRFVAGRCVTVRILDPQGAEVPELHRSVRFAGGHGAWTDARGLLVAPDARFRLSVSTAGRLAHEVEVAESDLVGDVLTVRLPRGPVVRGRVMFAGDVGERDLCAFAVVRTLASDPKSAWMDLGPDGAFTLAGLPDGAGWLDVVERVHRRGNRRLERVPFTLAGDDLDLAVIRVAPLVRFEGVAVDDRDVPVAGAYVLVMSGNRVWIEAEPDDSGGFRADVPEGAAITVFAASDALVSDPVETTAVGDGRALQLRMRRSAQVLVAEPRNVAGDVGLTFASPGGSSAVHLELTRRPGYRLSAHLPPGTWDLRAALGSRTWTRRVTVASNDVVEWTLGD